MLEKLQRNLRNLVFALKSGVALRDQFELLRLLMKHIAVNRGWSNYDGSLHRIRACRSGHVFTVHLRDNGTDIIIFEDVFNRHCYEFDANPKSIVDAGANIGLASLYFSLAYPQASIVSIEPVEHVMCKLNTSEVLQGALGKSDGVINILLDPKNSGGHRLELYDTDVTLQRLQVPLNRLDTLINEGRIIAPDFLKIDAEGAECDILEGLGAYIKNLRYFVAETQSKKNHESIVAHLCANGFTEIEERILHPDAHLPGDAYSIIFACR